MKGAVKKIYRSSISFTKAELRATMTLDSAGIQIGKPAIEESSRKAMMSSLGLFGGNSDSNKFYENIKGAAELKPKPEDFAEVPFRLLTATTVGAWSWKATDFSNAAVLEKSMPLLQSKPVYKNHDTEVDNWVGLVKEVKWTPQFKNAKGETIPAGIDGILALDAKTNPKMVRGVLMGAIYSNSVTVEFDWEASHDFATDEEFARNVGKMVKGEMVRRKVTAIYNYHETSLVFLGADPFAKLLTAAGDLEKVDTASIYYDKADAGELETFTKQKKYALGFGLDQKIISLSKDNFSDEPSTQTKPEEMNKELLAFLRVFLNLAADADETTVMAAFTKSGGTASDEYKVVTAKAGVLDTLMAEVGVVTDLGQSESSTKVTLTSGNALPDTFKPADYQFVKKTDVTAALANAGKVAALTTEVGALTTDKAALAKDAKIGKDFIELKRTEAIRLYKLAVGDKATEAVENLFKTAEPDAVEGLLAQYAKGAAMKFSGKCKACGSHDFEFRSSFESKEEQSEGKGDAKVLDFDDIHKKYDRSGFNLAPVKEVEKK